MVEIGPAAYRTRRQFDRQVTTRGNGAGHAAEQRPECQTSLPPSKVCFRRILLQKSLAALLNSDSVVLMRFAVEAIDDGAAQSRPR